MIDICIYEISSRFSFNIINYAYVQNMSILLELVEKLSSTSTIRSYEKFKSIDIELTLHMQSM